MVRYGVEGSAVFRLPNLKNSSEAGDCEGDRREAAVRALRCSVVSYVLKNGPGSLSQVARLTTLGGEPKRKRQVRSGVSRVARGIKSARSHLGKTRNRAI